MSLLQIPEINQLLIDYSHRNPYNTYSICFNTISNTIHHCCLLYNPLKSSSYPSMDYTLHIYSLCADYWVESFDIVGPPGLSAYMALPEPYIPVPLRNLPDYIEKQIKASPTPAEYLFHSDPLLRGIAKEIFKESTEPNG